MRVRMISIAVIICLGMVLVSCSSEQPSDMDDTVNEILDLAIQDEHYVMVEPVDAYLEFVNADESLVVVYFATEDLDRDGYDEAVLALGSSPTDITYVYVMRERDGVIEKVGENLAGSGYNVHEVKLVTLQNEPGKYIYLGLTNFAQLTGFELLQVSGNNIETVVYSASATGSGNDKLMDYDGDGHYDGYEQNRASYDVLYFPVTRTFLYEDGHFELSHTNIDLPPYPSKIEDVVIQYISLKGLNIEKSLEYDQRMDALFIGEHGDDHVNWDDWYETISFATLHFDRQLVIEDNGETAVAIFSSEDNDDMVFDLAQHDGKWQIVNIKLEKVVEQVKVVKSFEEYDAVDRPLIAAIPDRNVYLYSNKDGTVALHWEDNICEFEWPYMTPRFILPRMHLHDFDGDGVEELAVILYIGSGTSVSVEELHIVKQVDGQITDDVFDRVDYTAQINHVVGFNAVYNEDEFKGELTIGKESYTLIIDDYLLSEYGRIEDGIVFGNIVGFSFEDNVLKAEFVLGIIVENYILPAFIGSLHADVTYRSGEFILENFSFEEQLD